MTTHDHQHDPWSWCMMIMHDAWSSCMMIMHHLAWQLWNRHDQPLGRRGAKLNRKMAGVTPSISYFQTHKANSQKKMWEWRPVFHTSRQHRIQAEFPRHWTHKVKCRKKMVGVTPCISYFRTTQNLGGVPEFLKVHFLRFPRSCSAHRSPRIPESAFFWDFRRLVLRPGVP